LEKKYNEEVFNELENPLEYFVESITDIKNNFNKYEDVYMMLVDEESIKMYLQI